MVNVLTIFAFISSFLSFSIVAHTLRLSRRSRFTLTFAIFVLCQGIWSFSYMMLYPSVDMANVRLWYAVSGFGWIPLHSVGIHFVLVFAGHREALERWWLYPVLYAVPTVLLVRHLTGCLVTAEFGVGPHGVHQNPALGSPWFWAFVAYSIVTFGVRLVLLLRFRRRVGHALAGRHARVLMVADASTLVLIWLANYFVPASGVTAIPSLGAVIIVILPLAGWYIIRRQRFLSYNLYFRFQNPAHASMSSVYREIFNIESIFDAVENGVALIDNQYRVFRTNAVLDALVGAASPAGSQPCYRVLYGRNAPCGTCPLGIFEPEGGATRDSIEIRTVQSAKRTVSRTMFPVREASGRTSGIMEIVRDVTTELRTRAERGYLLHAVENTPAQIIISEFDGTTIYVNHAFRVATGLSMKEIRGHPFWSYYRPTNSPDAIEEIAAAVHRREPWQGSIIARNPDGTNFAGRLVLVPMIDADPSYLLAYVVDTTEERRAQRMRENVERTIRHDLKSPLTAILGMSEILLNEVPDGTGRELVEGIADGAKRMRDIIESSFALHKMEEGTYELRPEPEDVLEILADTKRELDRMLVSRRISVITTVDGGDPTDPVSVLGERCHLQSMLSNLLKNAIEAGPPGTDIHVAVQTGEPVRIRIHNEALVPAEIHRTLFRPYVTAGKQDGTGLGLFSAQLIASAHRGDIEFRSVESEGTTFTVTLPRATGTPLARRDNGLLPEA